MCIRDRHIADYTAITQHLDKMTSTNFNWDEATWTVDYRQYFEDLRLKDSVALHFPDHTLQWVLRTDASQFGYGGVLYQIYEFDVKKLYQPLKFMSKKFSDAATRWDTFSQECYAIFACVKDSEYLLRGKPFIIETDHANLLWMESSTVPKIIRQHLYLRNFKCYLRHYPGKINTADYWSRLVDTDPAKALAYLEVLYELRSFRRGGERVGSWM